MGDELTIESNEEWVPWAAWTCFVLFLSVFFVFLEGFCPFCLIIFGFNRQFWRCFEGFSVFE